MAGDEIVADWLGDVFSDQVFTTSSPQRFFATSKRFRSFHIVNLHATESAYIGKFYADAATFQANAAVIHPKTALKFEFIDINELGYKTRASAVYLGMIGINEY